MDTRHLLPSIPAGSEYVMNPVGAPCSQATRILYLHSRIKADFTLSTLSQERRTLIFWDIRNMVLFLCSFFVLILKLTSSPHNQIHIETNQRLSF